MRTLLCSLCFAAALAGQTSMAHVNDARSHGVLGDALLSLDEGIRLVNEQLTLAQLSPAERARIMGPGPVTMIVIESAVTPVVMLERLLTPLDGPPVATLVHIQGLGTVAPVLSAAGQDVALRIRTDRAQVHGLLIRGGRTGISADASVHAQPGAMLELMDLAFEGQTEAGLRLQATATATEAMAARIGFAAQATAIAIDDFAGGAGVMLTAHNVEFRDVQLGVGIDCDAQAGTTMCELFHARMTASQCFARSRRSPGSTRRIMLMLRACDVVTTGDAIDMQGNIASETLLHHHHCDLVAQSGQRAIHLWPQDGIFDLHGSENLIAGAVEIAAGRLTRRLWIWNSTFRDAAITFTNQGVRPSLRWNRFDGCWVRAAAGNSTPLALASSEFYGCVLDGQSASGIVVENSWLEKTVQNGSVQVFNPSPSPWFGRAEVSTSTPVLGGSVDLTLDLPVGMCGVWHLGLADQQPLFTEEPWRFYALRQTLVPLPGVAILHTTVRLPIPVTPSLAKVELYAQPMVVPFHGQAHVPAWSLPRGAYLMPRAR